MNFSNDFFGVQGRAIRHRHMTAAVESLHSASPRILEIGAWAGCSTVTWCEAMERYGKTGSVWCIDPWKPYLSGGNAVETAMNDAATSGRIMSIFMENVKGLPVHILQGTSQEVCPILAHRSFDFIYIDGAHDYESVSHDIVQAKRLVREGGIVCGDDLEMPHTKDESTLRKLREQANLESTNEGHPGVTLAVSEAFDEVACFDGFWAVRFVSGRYVPLEIGKGFMPKHLGG